MPHTTTASDTRRVAELADRRVHPGRTLSQDAGQLTTAAHEMAQRFHRGGKLIVFASGSAATDAAHIAVEFVHPVIVGKRALPAISLTSDIATCGAVARSEGGEEVFSHQLRALAGADDIALAVSPDGHCPDVLRGLALAREIGMLTIALSGGDGGSVATSGAVQHCIVAHSDDPRVVKEVHVTSYHILWELVHIFFEQPGVLDSEVAR